MRNQTAYFPVEIQDVDLEKLNDTKQYPVITIYGNDLMRGDALKSKKYSCATHILIEKSFPVNEPLKTAEGEAIKTAKAYHQLVYGSQEKMWEEAFELMLKCGDAYSHDFKSAVKLLDAKGFTITKKLIANRKPI